MTKYICLKKEIKGLVDQCNNIDFLLLVKSMFIIVLFMKKRTV